MNMQQAAHQATQERGVYSLSAAFKAAAVIAREQREQGRAIKTKDLQAEVERIWQLRADRRARKTNTDPLAKSGPATLRYRAARRRIDICIEQIEARGLDVPTGFWSQGVSALGLASHDRQTNTWLCTCSYRYEYSKAFGAWWQNAAYLCGKDDAGYWAMRVPSTCQTVADAIQWAYPAAVLKAQAEGRRVWRQGDILAVELKAGKDNTDALRGTRHEFRDTRYLVHPEHNPVRLPQSPVKFFQIRQISGSARRAGD